MQRLAARSIWTRRAIAALILGLGLWSVSMRSFGAPNAHESADPGGHAAQHVD